MSEQIVDSTSPLKLDLGIDEKTKNISYVSVSLYSNLKLKETYPGHDFIILPRTADNDGSKEWYATKINGKWYHFKILFDTFGKYKTITPKSIGLKKGLNYLTLVFKNDYKDPNKPKAGSYFFDNLFTSEQVTNKETKKKTHTYIFVYTPDTTTTQKSASRQFWKNLIKIENPKNLNQENDYDHSTTYKGGKRGTRKVRSTLSKTRRIPRKNARKSRRLKNKSLLNK
jgi:hypothetical protein